MRSLHTLDVNKPLLPRRALRLAPLRLRASCVPPLLAASLLLGTATLASAADGAGLAGRLDPIFAQWNKKTSPGCALAVLQRGHIEYAHGYGMANLELGVPLSTHSVFDIGSVSKQFTAASVVLLAQDGRLSLDDEIHKYVPELPDYGAPISLRQMLHHLSGLRSYTDLFDLAGIPEANITTEEDALALIARQHTLNFAPGAQYLYSDTNYFLLGVVVHRVSGKSLRDFAQERLFGPLGMTHTHFHDDHRMIVAGRATGYTPTASGGFEILMSNFEELGDGSVMTTVEDMARWDANFYDPKVGGKALIAQLLERGARSDGSASDYALGMIQDHYRGLPRVQHTGEWAGYRASYQRFAQQGVGIVLLCNSVGSLDTLALGERVADQVLGKAFPAAKPTPAPVAAVNSAGTAYAGRYWDAKTFSFLQISAPTAGHPDRLVVDAGDGPQPLRVAGPGLFTGENSTSRYAFTAATPDTPQQVSVLGDDSDPVILEALPADASTAVSAADLAPLAGTYENTELGARWTLEVQDGHLYRRQPYFGRQELRPLMPDTFRGELSEGSYVVRVQRDEHGQVSGLQAASLMVRPLPFVRLP